MSKRGDSKKTKSKGKGGKSNASASAAAPETNSFDLVKKAAELHQSAQQLQEEMQRRIETVQLREEKLNAERERMEEETGEKDLDVLMLNVGGVAMAAYRSTLCKFEGTWIEALFSGRHAFVRDANEAIFVDRPPKEFGIILDWLRRGWIIFPNDEREMKMLAREIEYYGLAPCFLGPVAPGVLVSNVGDVDRGEPVFEVDDAGTSPREYFGHLARFVHEHHLGEAAPQTMMDLRGVDFVDAKQGLKPGLVDLVCQQVGARYKEVSFTLEYRHSQHSSNNVTNIKNRTQGKGPLVFVCRSASGSVFGFFTPQTTNMWASNTYTRETTSFTFVLHATNHEHAPCAIPVDQATCQHAVYQNGGNNVCAGSGHDIIWTISNKTSSSNVNQAYKHPTCFASTANNFYNGGNTNWTELEVYSVAF